MSTYALDNAAEQAAERFASLESCFDSVTIRHLEDIGVASGWSCLEVGGGGGSVARWLADRVAPDGEVVVTDINPCRLDANRPNLELRCHDIVRDPLEPEAFDLAHERLVLIHLPERERALHRMIGALKPGGWLLIEDFDLQWLPLTPTGSPSEIELFLEVTAAFRALLERAGVDPIYARRLPSLLREHGLIDVSAEAHFQMWTGGSPTARLMHSNIEQVRGRLTGAGLLTDRDIDGYLALMENPEFSCNFYPMVSARGRRPLR
jgi:ubiquinone/menaquinone biosynthesis C-methylase UbiE